VRNTSSKLSSRIFFAILAASLTALAIIYAEDAPSKAKTVMVNSFESPQDLQALMVTNAKVSLTTEHVTDGKSALKVEFGQAGPSSIGFPSGTEPWDWHEYGGLAFDLSNPNDKEIGFSIQLSEASSSAGPQREAGGSGTLIPHETASFYYPIGATSPLAQGMRGGPPAIPGIDPVNLGGANAWIDAGRIKEFHLSFRHPAGAPAVIVDNIRLLPPFDYQGIVDSFGQYTREDWPGKVRSLEDLLAQKQQEEEQIKAQPAVPERDEYGGWASGPLLAATGFFSTVERQGRWWLVDPSGRLFFSLGMDVMGVPANGDAYTLVDGRENMFTWLPSGDDPLAKCYDYAHYVLYGPIKKGRTFSFYVANLYRKYGADWLGAWRTFALSRLRAWGFNTIGNWSDPALYAYKKVPYTATIDIHGDYAHISSGVDYWGKMHDPFDPKFAQAVDASIRQGTEKFRDDPWCIGYFVDNEISWGGFGNVSDKEHYGLAYGTLAGDKPSPAKRAFVEQLQSRSTSIAELNKAWGTNFASWPALLEKPFHPQAALAPQMREDFSNFLTTFAEQYFRVVRDALRKNDPHHLYLGCRFAWRTPEAVNAAARYCDVVSFNIYRSHLEPEDWAFTASLNKPCIIGEFHFGALDRGMFHTGLVRAPSQQARAAMYKQYLESVEDNPAFVGCHWFQYYDEPLTGRPEDGENYNIGFVSVADTPYPEMVDAAKAVHAEIYKRRSGE
jgi:hypothetical protein